MSKFEKEESIVLDILSHDKISDTDKMRLLNVYQTTYHDSGKIEGMNSCDGSCNHCSFCKKVRENGKDNPLLICNYCYDNEQEKRWTTVYNRHGLNLLIMKSVLFTKEQLATLAIGSLCRFNSSGEIENVIQAKNYINIAYSHPYTRCGLFAKNTHPVIIATDETGKPDNCRYIQSSLLIGIQAKLAKHFDHTFTVYPDEISLQKALASGSNECNGKKCKECGYKCYTGDWKTGTNIAEILRLAKNKESIRNNIINALHEYENKLAGNNQ